MMIPVNEAQQQLQDLIDSVSQSHEPIVIAGESSNAVLLSEAD
jgi:antitoxin YefM